MRRQRVTRETPSSAGRCLSSPAVAREQPLQRPPLLVRRRIELLLGLLGLGWIGGLGRSPSARHHRRVAMEPGERRQPSPAAIPRLAWTEAHSTRFASSRTFPDHRWHERTSS